jgi:hypothetical protein
MQTEADKVASLQLLPRDLASGLMECKRLIQERWEKERGNKDEISTGEDEDRLHDTDGEAEGLDMSVEVMSPVRSDFHP